jgi:CRP/FNR family transcriptional regulator, dissimilatory nitrate respiration regulator
VFLRISELTLHPNVVERSEIPPFTHPILKQKVLLSRLSPGLLAEIERRSVVRVWPRNTAIFRMQDECTGVHFVREGLVKLYRGHPNGREQIILLEGPGGALAIAPMFDDFKHITSARTLPQTTTMFLPQEDFLHLYNTNLEFRDAVTNEMARRFRSLIELVETITLKSVPARVATHLIELAAAHDALDGTQTFNLMLSQDELAHVLATSRESVARALAELRGAKIIEQRGAKIRVVDAEALAAWSQATTPVQSFSEAFRLRGDR